jgi:hypothetical protein
MKALLLKWWLFLCLQGAVFAIANHFNFFQDLVVKDPTRIGFGILIILIVTTIWIGQKVYKLSKLNVMSTMKDELLNDLSMQWFIAESCLVLGLVGTVCGFILMLGTAFVDIDVSNIQSMQNALSQMSIGMSAALYTTLMGLLSSLVIKIQLVNVERAIEQA